MKITDRCNQIADFWKQKGALLEKANKASEEGNIKECMEAFNQSQKLTGMINKEMEEYSILFERLVETIQKKVKS